MPFLVAFLCHEFIQGNPIKWDGCKSLYVEIIGRSSFFSCEIAKVLNSDMAHCYIDLYFWVFFDWRLLKLASMSSCNPCKTSTIVQCVRPDVQYHRVSDSNFLRIGDSVSHNSVYWRTLVVFMGACTSHAIIFSHNHECGLFFIVSALPFLRTRMRFYAYLFWRWWTGGEPLEWSECGHTFVVVANDYLFWFVHLQYTKTF